MYVISPTRRKPRGGIVTFFLFSLSYRGQCCAWHTRAQEVVFELDFSLMGRLIMSLQLGQQPVTYSWEFKLVHPSKHVKERFFYPHCNLNTYRRCQKMCCIIFAIAWKLGQLNKNIAYYLLFIPFICLCVCALLLCSFCALYCALYLFSKY